MGPFREIDLIARQERRWCLNRMVARHLAIISEVGIEMLVERNMRRRWAIAIPIDWIMVGSKFLKMTWTFTRSI